MDFLENLHQDTDEKPASQDLGSQVEHAIVRHTVSKQAIQTGQRSSQVSNERIKCNNPTPSTDSVKSQTSKKVSAVIRKELITEETTDVSKPDELSTYLITSSLRHMDSGNVFQPLLYHHLIADFNHSQVLARSPEGEAVQRLDDLYATAFDTAVETPEVESISIGRKNYSSSSACNTFPESGMLAESSLNVEHFGTTQELTALRQIRCDDIVLSNNSKDASNDTSSESESSAPSVIRVESASNLGNVASFSNSSSASSSASVSVSATISTSNSSSSSSPPSFSPTPSTPSISPSPSTSPLCSHSPPFTTELSLPSLSRQAPEGGNPIESSSKSLVTQLLYDSQGNLGNT